MRKYPLKGKTVLVTRASEQSGSFISRLESLGASVISFPVIEIRPVNTDLLIMAINHIQQYQWLIFTSTNTVEIFFRTLFRQNPDIKNLSMVKIAVVGHKTGEALKKNGLLPELVPASFTADGLVSAFSKLNITDQKILLPVASLAKNSLPAKLEEMGANVDVIHIYDTALPENHNFELLNNLKVDYITFTSSSTATNFSKIISENGYSFSAATKLVSIGPVTTKTVKELFSISPLEAEVYTVDGMVEEIIKDAKKQAG